MVCIASGPSLTQAQLELVRAARERDAVRVAVVNDMYLLAPWADLLYFADARWWNDHVAGLERSWPWIRFSAEQVREAFKTFAGQKVSIQHPQAVKGHDVLLLRNLDYERLSENPEGIHTGGNSGYQAFNVVTLGGAKRILLVAYDMRVDGKRTHSHNGHKNSSGDSSLQGFAKLFSSTENQLRKLGVEVLNCTPGSRIEAFPKAPLEQALECRAPTA